MGTADALIGYAAAHRDWSGAPALVRAQAAKLSRRVTLMTEDRTPIADSAAGPSLRNARPSDVVDPLNLDLGLTGGTSRIDSRAVGPFKLTPAERDLVYKVVDDELTCLRIAGVKSVVVEAPSGRPSVSASTALCHHPEIATRTERQALAQLARLTASCLGVDASRVRIGTDFAASVTGPAADPARLRGCLEKSRRTPI